MIQQLVALADNLRQHKLKGEYVHDALDNVSVSIDCVIDRKGKFRQFIQHEPKSTVAEAITAKKGKARLLVDRAEEVLNYGKNAIAKNRLFLRKLKQYSHLQVLSPVLSFYGSNKAEGFQRAHSAFSQQVLEKDRRGNIAFSVAPELKRLNENREVRKAIISIYEATQAKLKSERFPRCSVCGSADHAIVDIPHGMIKRVPDGQKSGCALISYNDKAYESYELEGNENSTVCTHCARAYVDALNWLLRPSSWKLNEKTGKQVPIFKNRKDVSTDTAIVFWLRDQLETSELDLLDKPDEGRIQALFDSVYRGRATAVKHLDADKFYAITLSGAAARIAVRDWIETSVSNLLTNLARWFQDIEIVAYDKERKIHITHYPSYSSLVWNVRSKDGNDVQRGRVGATLWKCAVMGHPAPLWLMTAVLKRIRAEQGRATSERIALLKLSLNRRINHQEGRKYMSALDETNKNIAYTCGRIFAVLESIQYYALGSDINAGIRQRFFSFASTMPAPAFGRLMKLTQHHLSKVRGENIGLAVNLDKRLQHLMCDVTGTQFPAVFSLEDQASFAIGYYHQRQRDFESTSNDKEK